MEQITIRFKNDQTHYTVGDTVDGTAVATLSDNLTLANVTVAFHCVGEVKWIDYPCTPAWMDGGIYNDQVIYHEQNLDILQKDVVVENNLKIVKKNSPSSMTSKQGCIKYFVQFSIKNVEMVKHFFKDFTVDSPMDTNLLITVGGTGEKMVYFHHGIATMHASLARRGYTSGETVNVHILVDNNTNTSVVPVIDLQQVQVFMSGSRHKTVLYTISAEPVSGKVVPPYTANQHANLDVAIPTGMLLSIKSSLISIKYFVHVTLQIPHSLDLHVNLPLVITTKKVIDQLTGQIL